MPYVENRDRPAVHLLDFCAALYLIGLVCSKALLAIGMVSFTLVAIYSYRDRLRKPHNVVLFLFPILIFDMTLISGLNSSDLGEWWAFIMKKSPFLFLPIAFYAARDRIAGRYYDFLIAFVIIVAVVSLGVLTNYLMNFEVVNEAIGKGKVITTPISHTEFSIFVAFAAVVSLFLYMEEERVVRIGTKSTLLLLSLFLVIFLHILAMRSGLVVLYGTALVMSLYTFLKKRNTTLFVGFLVAMFIFPMTAVKVIPSLKAKLDYVNWDMHRMRVDKGLNHSDSERIYSLRAGAEVFRSKPIMGEGVGDLMKRCQEIYVREFGQAIDHFPHSQYIFVLAGMGLIGFIFYAIGLLGPFVMLWGRHDPYFLSLYCVIFMSAFVENTLERTFSIGFYLFFVLASICFLSRSWEQQK